MDVRPSGTRRRDGTVRPVAESTRIHVISQLDEFQLDESLTTMKFSDPLSGDDRAYVHAEALRRGWTSKSHGTGADRRVHVYKPNHKRNNNNNNDGDGADNGGSSTKGEGLTPPLPLHAAPEHIALLRAHFETYPPTEKELRGNAAQTASQAKKNTHNKKQKRAEKRLSPQSPLLWDDAKIAHELKRSNAARMSPATAPIVESAAKLPVAAYRETLTTTIRQSAVTVVVGETGCGKTTQVPQFILDDAWERGERCRVLCTQPRRVSAMSVAERVGRERGFNGAGDEVGYSVRLETRGGAQSSLMFVTNGVLLRRLSGAGAGEFGRASADDDDESVKDASSLEAHGLEDVTHVVMDEIHERDVAADFCMIALVETLQACFPRIRLVLMSATVEADSIQSYFERQGLVVNTVNVPGFTHPVEELFLEDVLDLTGATAVARREMDAERQARPADAWRSHVPAGDADAIEASMDKAITGAFLSGALSDWEALFNVVASVCLPPPNAGGAPLYPLVNFRHSETQATPLMVAAAKGNADAALALLSRFGADASIALPGSSPGVAPGGGILGTAHEWATRFGKVDVAQMLLAHADKVGVRNQADASRRALDAYQMSADPDEVDVDLILRCLDALFVEGGPAHAYEAAQGGGSLGAVLIFLPGLNEITRMCELLARHHVYGNPRAFITVPLHSSVPPAEQRKVFQRPPPGVRKIVCSTNLAETAVTMLSV